MYSIAPGEVPTHERAGCDALIDEIVHRLEGRMNLQLYGLIVLIYNLMISYVR